MSIYEQIKEFNELYKLPVNKFPTLDIGTDVATRLGNFKQILLKEIDEIDDIIKKVENTKGLENSSVLTELENDVLTDLSDLLGDIQVYCLSEMCKFGLRADNVLEIIMASNMSKLGADGLPIYDAQGKVQKGPNYWKPEPLILRYTKAVRKYELDGDVDAFDEEMKSMSAILYRKE